MREASETDFFQSPLSFVLELSFGLLQKKHSQRLLFLSISEFDFANLPTVASNKEEKRFTKRGEKSWLHLLLVKCKSWKNGFKRKPAL